MFSDLGKGYEYVRELDDKKVAPAVPVAVVNEASNGALLHDEVKSAPQSTSAKRLEKRRQDFVPLHEARLMTWKGMPRMQKRKCQPSPGALSVWAIWDLIEEKSKDGSGTVTLNAAEIQQRFDSIIQEREMDGKMITSAKGFDRDTYFTTLETSFKQAGEFSPTCAMLGGVLSQDVLNALGGREEPIVNWFHLDGLTGEYKRISVNVLVFSLILFPHRIRAR